MCKYVGIRDSARNIDTHVISDLNKLKFKIVIIFYTPTLYL